MLCYVSAKKWNFVGLRFQIPQKFFLNAPPEILGDYMAL